jgi:hypothetical protein
MQQYALCFRNANWCKQTFDGSCTICLLAQDLEQPIYSCTSETSETSDCAMSTPSQPDPRRLLPADLSADSILSMSKTMAEEACVRYNIPHTSKEALRQLQSKLLYHRDVLLVAAAVTDQESRITNAVYDKAKLELNQLRMDPREDTGKGLQDQVAALSREVSVLKSPASGAPADASAPPPAALQYEQVVQETSLRHSRQLQVVISNLNTFPAESPDNIQADTEKFLREEMQVAEADSKVLAARRFRGTEGRLGPVIITCSSAAQRISILQAGKHLKGKSVWVNPNWTKMQAQEQFKLRQQRREAISHGFKAYFKSGKLIIDRQAQQVTAEPQATTYAQAITSQPAAGPSPSSAPLQAAPTASPAQPPTTTPAAAAATSSQQ